MPTQRKPSVRWSNLQDLKTSDFTGEVLGMKLNPDLLRKHRAPEVRGPLWFSAESPPLGVKGHS